MPPEPGALRAFAGFARREIRDDLASLGGVQGPFDLVHLFARDRAGLAAALTPLREILAPAGMIWVSWPKKASGVPTTLTEDVIRALALARGLVDVKVCAVDATWSGLKLVIPKALRQGG